MTSRSCGASAIPDKGEAEYARLLGLGVEILHGIVELPWQRLFRIRDLDGNVVEIGEAAKA